MKCTSEPSGLTHMERNDFRRIVKCFIFFCSFMSFCTLQISLRNILILYGQNKVLSIIFLYFPLQFSINKILLINRYTAIHLPSQPSLKIVYGGSKLFRGIWSYVTKYPSLQRYIVATYSSYVSFLSSMWAAHPWTWEKPIFMDIRSNYPMSIASSKNMLTTKRIFSSM